MVCRGTDDRHHLIDVRKHINLTPTIYKLKNEHCRMFNVNYNRIYASIVLRAQAEYVERKAGKRFGKYYESHHIIPKSLGGVDTLENRALLTAREHFLCHWLLVKIYPVGSDAHNKMLTAFWRMQSVSENHERYVFSRAYEKLRMEFAGYIGSITKIAQSGEKNSHYGSKWYTSYETGECKVFKGDAPGKPWVAGRYLFNGQSTSIQKFLAKKNKPLSKKHKPSIRIPSAESIARHEKSLNYARSLWNRYHYGNYYQLEEFANVLKISKAALYQWFKKYIPIFTTDKTKIKRKNFSSNPDLVGIYY